MTNALSIDVEECFQAAEIGASPAEWDDLPSRVEAQTCRVLEILARHSVRATFFILGWVARRHPQLVREIAGAGHEIGCHSYYHRLIYRLGPEEFAGDTDLAVEAIADAAGLKPRLYRAPSYSIIFDSLWALEILAARGFTHDSSIYPIAHDRYGLPEFGPRARFVSTPAGVLFEIPIATVTVHGTQLPVGGGGYLRLLPYRYTAAGIRRMNLHDHQPACVYLHPWELDPAQPHVGPGGISRLRTYAGVRKMVSKLESLLADFRFSTLGEVYPFARASESSLPVLGIPDTGTPFSSTKMTPRDLR